MMPALFISFAREEADWARTFSAELERRGFNLSYDQSFAPATEAEAEQREQDLRASDAIIFIRGPKSTETPNFLFELGAAVALNKRVTPVVSGRDAASQRLFLLDAAHAIVEESPVEAAGKVARAVA